MTLESDKLMVTVLPAVLVEAAFEMALAKLLTTVLAVLVAAELLADSLVAKATMVAT